ncbi:MAG: type II secretion system protein [candidate division WOR-3 bacterium]
MRKNSGFTLIEMLTVLFIIGVILAFSIPNYALVREKARISAQKMNMYNVAMVIEAYHSETGKYADDFYQEGYGPYFPGGDPYATPEPKMGKFPTNPWTGAELDPDNFNPDYYDEPEDVSNTQIGGPNDDWGYDPGEMRYGTYEPIGSNRIQLWGLIGMDGQPNGYAQSIRTFDASGQNIIIFVLHN